MLRPTARPRARLCRANSVSLCCLPVIPAPLSGQLAPAAHSPDRVSDPADAASPARRAAPTENNGPDDALLGTTTEDAGQGSSSGGLLLSTHLGYPPPAAS